jgi:nitrate reductase NapAB chaperone NapD
MKIVYGARAFVKQQQQPRFSLTRTNRNMSDSSGDDSEPAVERGNPFAALASNDDDQNDQSDEASSECTESESSHDAAIIDPDAPRSKTGQRKDRKRAIRTRHHALNAHRKERESIGRSLTEMLQRTHGLLTADIIRILVPVAQRVHAFATQSEIQSLVLPPMPSALRDIFKGLAAVYQLTAKSRGQGHGRALVVYITARTAHAVQGTKGDLESISGVLYAVMATKGIDAVKIVRDAQLKPRQGSSVGQDAPALDATNIGFRMLAQMGWSADTANADGADSNAAIQVLIKNDRRGF